jgi:two-component system sensor histidine kinase CpxA
LEELASIQGDTELLRRACEKVLSTEIRHAPEGTPIEVSLDQPGPGTKVVLRDVGPGVPPEALPRVFEPFFRLEGDRDRASGGVGLGLAIVRRAGGLHRGHIAARNAGPGLAVEIPRPAPRSRGLKKT